METNNEPKEAPIYDDNGQLRYDPKSKEYTRYDKKNVKDKFKVKDYTEALNLFQSERSALEGNVSKNILDESVDSLRYQEVRQPSERVEVKGNKITTTFKDGTTIVNEIVAPQGYELFTNTLEKNILAIKIGGSSGIFRISKLGTTNEPIFETPDIDSKFPDPDTVGSINFWKKYSARIKNNQLIIERKSEK